MEFIRLGGRTRGVGSRTRGHGASRHGRLRGSRGRDGRTRPSLPRRRGGAGGSRCHKGGGSRLHGQRGQAGRRGYAVAATGDGRLSTARPAVDGAQQQTRLRSPTPRRRVRPWRDWLLSAQMPHATLGCQVRPTQLTTTCLSTAHWSSKFWIGLIALDRILRASHRAEPLAKCPREAKPNAHRTDFPPFRVSYADDGQTKIPLFSRRLLCAPDH